MKKNHVTWSTVQPDPFFTIYRKLCILPRIVKIPTIEPSPDRNWLRVIRISDVVLRAVERKPKSNLERDFAK
ncbi:unnamed protein product [Dovyalis caffra]|uniref:Uncharacterized protein n=1 Tax=Dovyalis caffra TaxID=77055 RepID=A0AAV1R3B7_9ROSI|nr:unnamed protein product [Dovyalis caffra]